jgi:lipopolysaccharide export LptBFGC system permease protein LptF
MTNPTLITTLLYALAAIVLALVIATWIEVRRLKVMREILEDEEPIRRPGFWARVWKR